MTVMTNVPVRLLMVWLLVGPPLLCRAGALVTCSGLIMMALAGVGASTALGINWIATALVLIGVSLATIRLGGPKKVDAA